MEISSLNSRIVVDIGLPLQGPDGCSFDIQNYNHMDGPQLVSEGLLIPPTSAERTGSSFPEDLLTVILYLLKNGSGLW